MEGRVKRASWRVVEAAAVVLFVLQALRVFYAMLFARVYDALIDGEGLGALIVAGAVTLAMLVMPLLWPRRPGRARAGLCLSAIACALARVPLSVDWPAMRLLAAATVLGFSGIYVAGLGRLRPRILAPALAMGSFVDQLLRALGHTYDLGLRPWWWPVQLALSLAVVGLALRLAKGEGEEQVSLAEREEAGFLAGISYGAALFLLSSLLALPNAAARWTSSSYAGMVACQMVLSTLPLWPGLWRWLARGELLRSFYATLLAISLALLGLAFADQGRAGVSSVAMVATVAIFWLLLPQSLRSGSRGGRVGVAAGMLILLLLGVAHAFSYTYAYTLEQFRGAGLPTFLLAVALALGPSLWPGRARGGSPVGVLPGGWSPWLAAGLLGWLWACLVAVPRPPGLLATTEVIRLGTYNIHYGYDAHWHLSIEEQARTIEESGADLVALQEVDAGRLTSFGIDDALWLGRRLGMREIYLPTVEHTTGIALLSRLDFTEAEGRLLPSVDEPTGILGVKVIVGGAPLKAYGIWLGLSPEERAAQLTGALAFIGSGRVSLAGDMNATPDSPVYSTMISHQFVDPFVAGGFPPGPTAPAESPQERIDYVWLRGLAPTGARVMDSIASDHRMVVVQAR